MRQIKIRIIVTQKAGDPHGRTREQIRDAQSNATTDENALRRHGIDERDKQLREIVRDEFPRWVVCGHGGRRRPEAALKRRPARRDGIGANQCRIGLGGVLTGKR